MGVFVFVEHPLPIGISTSMLLSTAPQGKKVYDVASSLEGGLRWVFFVFVEHPLSCGHFPQGKKLSSVSEVGVFCLCRKPYEPSQKYIKAFTFKTDIYQFTKNEHFLILLTKRTVMQNLIYVNWSNGAIIMTVVFGLVILGLVYAVMSMMNKGKKKEDETS